jgi:anti-anti-sigma regulatory factor
MRGLRQDRSGALELELVVMRVCLDRAREIDLRELRSMDSSGARGLALSRSTCEEHLVDLRFLAPADGPQRELFARYGL